MREDFMSSIFQKIIAGEIPCHRLYEDEHVLAFLDVNPLSPGHALVIPKVPARTLEDLSDDAAAAIGRALPPLCKAIRQATGIDDYNVLQNNGLIAHQVVPHVHFHIIPKPGLRSGLRIRWPAGILDEGEGRAMAEDIRQALTRERTGEAARVSRSA